MTPEEFDEAAHRLLQAEQVPMMPDFCALAIVLYPKVLTWQSLATGGSAPAPLGRGRHGRPRRRPLRPRGRRLGWRPGRRGPRLGERRRGGDDAPLGAGEGPPRRRPRRKRRRAPGADQEQQKERGQGHQRLRGRCLPPPMPDNRLRRDLLRVKDIFNTDSNFCQAISM